MTRFRKTAAAGCLAGIFLLSAALAVAGEVPRKVGAGESLSGICRDVYGDAGLYRVVALYNGKEDPRRIRKGEILRLPYSDRVQLRKGESLSALARRTWGDPKLYPLIAWANGVRDASKVAAGTHLMIPVLVPYRLSKGESISSVAESFYGNPKAYGIIVTASGIGDPSRVKAGTVLKVPYVVPEPETAKKTAVKKVSAPAREPVPEKSKPVTEKASSKRTDARTERARTLLTQAREKLRAGIYGEAWTAASEASGELEGKEKAEAFRVMALTQYAFGKTDAAVEDLVKAHELDPEFKPDPAYVNPEMRLLYEQASKK